MTRPDVTRSVLIKVDDADPVEYPVRMPAWVADAVDRGDTVYGLELIFVHLTSEENQPS